MRNYALANLPINLRGKASMDNVPFYFGKAIIRRLPKMICYQAYQFLYQKQIFHLCDFECINPVIFIFFDLIIGAVIPVDKTIHLTVMQ